MMTNESVAAFDPEEDGCWNCRFGFMDINPGVDEILACSRFKRLYRLGSDYDDRGDLSGCWEAET